MEARWEEDGMGFSGNICNRADSSTPAFCPALAWSGSGEWGVRSEEGGRFASTCGLRLRGCGIDVTGFVLVFVQG